MFYSIDFKQVLKPTRMAKKKQKMNDKIVLRDINELIEAEYNPRELTEDQAKHLTDSLKRFGFVDPVLVNINKDRKDIIIGGHQRTKIAKQIGYTEVPCIEMDLTYDQEKELNIRLNKNTGQFDMDMLANHFEVYDLVDWGFEEKDIPVFDIDPDEFGDGFDLPDGDKEPFQQMTFTLADEQHQIVKEALEDVKHTENYKYIETYGNENSNANALYTIITEWVEQKK